MPTYVTLFRYTPEGVRNIKEGPSRFADVKRNIEAVGGKVLCAYMLMGRYDGLVVSEGPDEKAVLKVLLAAGRRGTTSTETMVAIPLDEAFKIAQEL